MCQVLFWALHMWTELMSQTSPLFSGANTFLGAQDTRGEADMLWRDPSRVLASRGTSGGVVREAFPEEETLELRP